MKKLFYTNVQNNPISNGKRMASAVTIMCCLKNTNVNLDLNCTSALFEMLRLMPDIESKKCIDWDYLNELIPNEFKSIVLESIQVLANNLIQKTHLSHPEWLYAMPILHFLCGASLPFQDRIFSPSEIPWQSKQINLGRVRSLTYESYFG